MKHCLLKIVSMKDLHRVITIKCNLLYIFIFVIFFSISVWNHKQPGGGFMSCQLTRRADAPDLGPLGAATPFSQVCNFVRVVSLCGCGWSRGILFPTASVVPVLVVLRACLTRWICLVQTFRNSSAMHLTWSCPNDAPETQMSWPTCLFVVVFQQKTGEFYFQNSVRFAQRIYFWTFAAHYG